MDSSAAKARTDDSLQSFNSVSLLGHDLRAAMSDVIGGLRLIDPQGLDEKTRIQLERVRSASEALARLIEHELVPPNTVPGFDEPSGGNVHLLRLLGDMRHRWTGRAEEKGLEFRMSVAADLPRVVSMDRIALERVASNILSNALKFADQGAVRVIVDLLPDQVLRLQVEDDGPGFSASAMETLFAGGARVDGRGKPGHGLGLRISKDMMDRLGGSITATNGAHGGAVVTVLVPCKAWLPPDDVRNGEETLPDLSLVRVLVADDSPTNQAVIGNMLAAMGAEFELAADGVETMNWLDRERFDILLLDIEMPRMSGLEVLRELRRPQSPLAAMPVLAISAYVLRANREVIYQAGADGILAKPVLDIHSFGLSLRRILNRMGAQPENPKAEAKPADAFNRERFQNLMQISGPFGAVELLRRLTQDLQQVERGVLQALSDENLAQLRSHTHVLISVSGAVGAEGLQAQAQALNDLAHWARIDEIRRSGETLLQNLDWLIHLIAQELSSRTRANT